MKHRGCGKDLAKVSEFIDGGLPAAMCRRIRAHMDDCRPCRDFVASLRRAMALHRAQGRAPSPPPLAKAELRDALRSCTAALKKRKPR
ncbi:MAG: zf-HC2 domain-containing protein [Elusimicrobia bacterium]|nr:zf-HC2 domain-containing protein [Elusimicrobiota bacterium]